MARRIDVKPGQKITVLGDFQSGKTTLAKQLLRAQPAARIYDTIHEFGDLGVRVRRLDALQELVKRPDAPSHIVYQPPKSIAGELEHLSAWLRVALQGARKCTLAVDEMHAFFEDGKTQRAPPELSEHLRFGHKPAFGENGFMAITHRVADIPKIVLFGHHLFLFHDDLPHDIKALKGFIGDVADELPRLKRHHFIHVERGAAGGVQRYLPLPLR